MTKTLTWVGMATMALGTGAALAKGNELDAGAKKIVQSCTWDDRGMDSSCEALTEWEGNDALFADGKANATMLGWLSNSDVKMRWLAADKLRVSLTDEQIDGKAIDKMLAAAEKEQNEPTAKAMAMLIAGYDLGKLGKIDRAIAVAKAHKISDYTEEFVMNVGDANKDKKTLAYAQDSAKNASSSLRNAALNALLKETSAFPAEACTAVDTLRGDKDAFVAGRATSGLATSHKCAAHYDKLLKSLAAVDTKKDVGQDVGYALDGMCSDKAMSDAQRTKALAIAHKITDNKTIHVNTRYYTLSAALACDPKGGATYVATFKGDANKTLAERAQSLLKDKR